MNVSSPGGIVKPFWVFLGQNICQTKDKQAGWILHWGVTSFILYPPQKSFKPGRQVVASFWAFGRAYHSSSLWSANKTEQRHGTASEPEREWKTNTLAVLPREGVVGEKLATQDWQMMVWKKCLQNILIQNEEEKSLRTTVQSENI